MHRRVWLLPLVLVSLASCGPAQEPAGEKGNPVATVNGQPVYEADILGGIEGEMMQVRNREYELKSRALEEHINRRLAEAEAKKRGLTREEFLAQEVKIAPPTEEEIQERYQDLRPRLGGRTLEEIRPQLVEAMREAGRQQATQEFYRKLRESAKVEILLEPPRTNVAYDPTRVRGNPDAPVTIVEFTDFQCPFCERVQPTLLSLLKRYEGKVKLAFRDFPLREMHPQAQAASEASRCAGDQGKFWEYHDLLFAANRQFEDDELKSYARKLGLDGNKFDACLSSGKYEAAVNQDLVEAQRLGVGGTPAFFINGVFVNGALPESAFARIIDAELERLARKE
jgi:predicted DsbA family dithiol-disulfide isomerase